LTIRGREKIPAGWESQVDTLDLRVEPVALIPVGDDKVVVQARVVAHGRSSDMSLTDSQQ
jgi:hypothetical protein